MVKKNLKFKPTFKIRNRQERNHQLPRCDDFTSSGINSVSPILLTDDINRLPSIFGCIDERLCVEFCIHTLSDHSLQRLKFQLTFLHAIVISATLDPPDLIKRSGLYYVRIHIVIRHMPGSSIITFPVRQHLGTTGFLILKPRMIEKLTSTCNRIC